MASILTLVLAMDTNDSAKEMYNNVSTLESVKMLIRPGDKLTLLSKLKTKTTMSCKMYWKIVSVLASK